MLCDSVIFRPLCGVDSAYAAVNYQKLSELSMNQ